MSLPNNNLATSPVFAPFVSPYNRYTGPLEDFEQGGIALNDASQGLDYQIWYLSYNGDEDDPNYGDFTLTAETTLETAVILNVPKVTRVGLAFNQNADPFICYELNTCEAKYYYYDTVAADYVTATLPAGSKHVACCLDDHRYLHTATSDTILAYIRNGSLYYRQERDRFLTERLLSSTVGAGVLYKVGMSENLRLKFDIREGRGVRLSEIEGDICSLVGLPANQLDVEDLYTIIVRGFIVGGPYSAADTLRTLQQVYFHDMVEVDGKIRAVPRGGPILATIERGDLVMDGGSGANSSEAIDFESAREQGLEFPYKVHLQYACAESDYTPTKATAERISTSVKSVSEMSIDTAVNFTPDEAAQRAHIIQKIAWNEYEGTAKFGFAEDHAWLIPTDPINVPIRDGVNKRMRIVRYLWGDGYFKVEAVIDRISAYTSDAIGLTPITPELPPPTIPSDTTWEFMDIPTLVTSLDATGLHYYVAGRGDTATAWHGYELQRLEGVNYTKEIGVPTAARMGVTASTLADAPAEYPDTTNTVLVTMNVALESITHDAFLKGGNAALIGDEIIQFRDVVAESTNWRLSYLARGRLNTTPVAHSIGERFILLSSVTPVPHDVGLLNTDVSLRAVSYGQMGSEAATTIHTLTGQAQREWAPKWFVAEQSGSDWLLSWMPRWRLGNSMTPVKSIFFSHWRIKITNGGTTVVKNPMDPNYTYTAAEQTTDFGAPISSFTIDIMGINNLTGEGEALSETV